MSIFISRIRGTVEGMENHKVSCFSRTKRDGPISRLAGTPCREAPESQVVNMSKTERSNEFTCLRDPVLGAELEPLLGDPVVPDVNMMLCEVVITQSLLEMMGSGCGKVSKPATIILCRKRSQREGRAAARCQDVPRTHTENLSDLCVAGVLGEAPQYNVGRRPIK